MTNRYEVLDGTAGGAELLSKALDSKVLDAVPYLDKVMKVLRLRESVQDYWLAKKLASFIVTLDSVPPRFADKLIEKAVRVPGEINDLGNRVTQAVALSTDFDKPAIHAKLFIAYTDGALSAVQLGRHLTAISVIHTPDLIAFAGEVNPYFGQPNNMFREPQKPWLLDFEVGEPVAPCGYARAISMGGYRTQLLVTEFGVQFHTAMRVANEKLGQYAAPR